MDIDVTTIQQLTCLQLSGKISQEEQAELDELISGSQEAYDHYQTALAFYDSAEAKAIIYDGPRTKLRVWNEIENGEERRRTRYYSVAAIAATVTLALACLLYLLLPERQNSVAFPEGAPVAAAGISLQLPDGNTIDLSKTNGQVAVGATTLNNANKTLSYATTASGHNNGIATLNVPIGKDYKLELADGSEVWLNSATVVKFPFSFGESREITIDGEAYIKVAPAANKPFLVHLPGGTVQVLGTEFNINTYDSLRSSVALVKGAVKLLTPGSNQVIKPGYAATYSKGSEISTSTFDEDLILSWRQGIFKFEDASLQEICRVLPRWFGIEVVMDDPAIAKRFFSGQLNRNKPLDTELKKLAGAANIEYYFKGDVLHLK